MNEFLVEMASTVREMIEHVGTHLHPYGMHSKQHFILEHLWEEDGLTPGELAERIGVETPTITRSTQRMEVAGLVKRLPDPTDRRLVRVYLTERGQELRAHLPAALEEAVNEMLAGFSPQERMELRRYLARIRKNLSEKS